MKPNGRNKRDLDRLRLNTSLKWSPSGLGANLIREREREWQFIYFSH